MLKNILVTSRRKLARNKVFPVINFFGPAASTLWSMFIMKVAYQIDEPSSPGKNIEFEKLEEGFYLICNAYVP